MAGYSDQQGSVAAPSSSSEHRQSGAADSHTIWKQVVSGVVAAVVAGSYSSLLGFGAILLVQLDDPGSSLLVGTRQRSWLMSGAYLGSVIGCILATFLVKTFGPSRVMFWHTLPCIIGWGLQAMSSGFWPLVAGRFICGLACGVCVSSAQIYISETTCPRVRGILLILPETFAVGSLLMCFTLGLLLHWKMVAIVCGLLPNLIIFFVFLWLPESPTWLVQNLWLDEAAQSLLFFYGARYEADQHVQQILNGLEQTRMGVWETLRLMRHAVYRRPVLIIAAQMAILNFSGLHAMFGYAVITFRLARTGINEYHCAMLLAGIRIVCNLGTVAVIDKFGRRALLSVSGALCAIFLGVVGGYYYVRSQDDQAVANLHWLPLAGIVCIICSFSLGIGPISWVLFGEMLPSSVRQVYGSIIIVLWSFTFFVILQVFPDLMAMLDTHGTFWMFSAVCAVQVLFACCVIPETRLRTLEAIHQEHFASKVVAQNMNKGCANWEETIVT